MAPSDEGAVERSETGGEINRVYIAFTKDIFFISVPPLFRQGLRGIWGIIGENRKPRCMVRNRKTPQVGIKWRIDASLTIEMRSEWGMGVCNCRNAPCVLQYDTRDLVL